MIGAAPLRLVCLADWLSEHSRAPPMPIHTPTAVAIGKASPPTMPGAISWAITRSRCATSPCGRVLAGSPARHLNFFSNVFFDAAQPFRAGGVVVCQRQRCYFATHRPLFGHLARERRHHELAA